MAPRSSLLHLWFLLILQTLSLSLIAADDCRSNSTHVAWRCDECYRPPIEVTSAAIDEHRELLSASCNCCQWETLPQARDSAYAYLRAHIMAFDRPMLATLGFDDEAAKLPDGLDGGLIGPTIDGALTAKVEFVYTDALPRDIWQEYVLSYASVNEARSNWRPLLYQRLQPLIDDNFTDDLTRAVLALNTGMWTTLAPAGQESIVFVGGQTPLIFDTMSILAFGHASCTGLAILFINACRSLGIPARLVGTPAWHQDRAQGNHNWVEIWLDDQWHFMEPTALLRPATVDSLDADPCSRWFCSRTRFHGGVNTTRVSAARLSAAGDSFYRMAWEWDNQDVPGEDVTAYYERVCGACD